MNCEKLINGASTSKKRQRNKPNKRWSDEDIKQILEYIRTSQDFEKPTAKIYYTNLLKKVGIDATWDILKWKVRHLKANYHKAEEWRRNTGSGLLDSDEGISSIEEKLHKMCKFYKDLHDVFGQKNIDFPFNTYESSSTSDMLSSTAIYNESQDLQDCFEGFEVLDSEVEFSEVEDVECDKAITEVLVEPDLQFSSQSDVKNSSSLNKDKVKNFAKKLKKSAPKTAIDKLSALQSEKTEYLKSKMVFEKEKFTKELDLKERQFLEEVQKRKDEMELKRLEIEANERIQRYEIEIKYKNQK